MHSSWSSMIDHCHTSLLIVCIAALQNLAICLPVGSHNWNVRSNQTGIECINNRCPVTTVCNPSTNRCECENDFLVSVNPHMPCLMRKYLGELCIHSVQCSHIEHAVCVSNAKKRHELVLIPFKDLFADIRMVKHPEKYLPHKEFGRCECRAGYWPNQNHHCEGKRLESVECSVTNHCPDQNSHCNLSKRKCTCDFGHLYDPNQDRCLLNVDMFGVFCKGDLDCQARDDQMRCWMGICTCINNNRYDPFRGCGHIQPCKNGHTWNDFSKSCEPTVYNYKQPIWTILENKSKQGWREWTQLSAEVCFKMLVFGLVLVGAFFTLRKRRLNISGQMASVPTTLSRTEDNSTSRTRVSSNRMHAVHLRVNLTELERDALMVNLTPASRRVSLVSGSSSLPPYCESVDNRPVSNSMETAPLDSPPPSYYQLPTYDEAITGLAKNEDSCAKTHLNGNKNGSCLGRDINPTSLSGCSDNGSSSIKPN